MQGVYRVSDIRAAESELMAGLPADTLMARAAFALSVATSEVLRRYRGRVSGERVLGLIGPGNNGSDALWAMALLARRGVGVWAVAVGERPGHTADQMFTDAGGRWLDLPTATARSAECAVVLDGIAGLGSNRPVAPELVEFAARVRRAGGAVIAVDLPSGLDADSALPITGGEPITADYTVSFGALKPCLVIDPGCDFCGEVTLVDIGLQLPASEINTFDDWDAAAMLPLPGRSDHKYSRGMVGVLAGSAKYPGAGALAVRAARWGGAGAVVHLGSGAGAIGEVAGVLQSPNTLPTELPKLTALVIGPGLSEVDQAAVRNALEHPAPLVLDAAALEMVFGDKATWDALVERQSIGGVEVLTPHAGEAVKLAHRLGVEWGENQLGNVRALANATNCVVYLKGSIGLIAGPGGEVVVTRRTSEHLATAGSGDVLAGLLGSLLATGEVDAATAARMTAAAVTVHSIAAELIAEDGEPVVADELEEELPAAIAELRSRSFGYSG